MLSLQNHQRENVDLDELRNLLGVISLNAFYGELIVSNTWIIGEVSGLTDLIKPIFN